MKNTPPSAQTFVDVKPKKTYKVIISKVPSAQTEWEKRLNNNLAHILQLYPKEFDLILETVKKEIASERTRLLSVESMKMEEETELNNYSDDIEVSTNERIIEARNALRQSILSEMEK